MDIINSRCNRPELGMDSLKNIYISIKKFNISSTFVFKSTEHSKIYPVVLKKKKQFLNHLQELKKNSNDENYRDLEKEKKTKQNPLVYFR